MFFHDDYTAVQQKPDELQLFPQKSKMLKHTDSYVFAAPTTEKRP